MIPYSGVAGPAGRYRTGMVAGAGGRIRRNLRGGGGLTVLAAALYLFSLLFLGSILLTPHGWSWWVDHRVVAGREQGGIVTYTFSGQQYSVDDAGSQRTGPRNVYVIPSDPGDGRVDLAGTLVVDWTLTVGLFAVGTACLGAGVVRFRLRQHRRLSDPRPWSETYGDGIDRDTIAHLLAQQRKDGQRGR